jgi:hypothetical protein
MNAVISVIRWIVTGKAVAVATDQDVCLSLVEAGMASYYIRVVTAGGG